MSTAPIRFDRLQAGLPASVRAALPAASVVWHGQRLPHGAATDPLARLRIVAGPTEVNASRPVRTLPTAATLTLTAQPAGTDVVLRASGMSWSYRVLPGDDVTAQRDGLLTALDGALIDASFVASGADAIAITATSLGDLYGLGASGGTIVATASEAASVRVSDVEFLIELDVSRSDPTPRGGASAALSRWQTYARNREGLALLGSYGLGLPRGLPAVTPIDGLAGPTWQSRSRISFYVSTLSIHAESFIPIEAAEVTLNAP